MLHYTYARPRRDFGRSCASFLDEAGETLVDLRPDEALHAEFVDRSPCTTSVQVGPVFSEHEARGGGCAPEASGRR